MKIEKMIEEFRKERNWNHENKEKDLALSISIEAAELLENFQWIDSTEALESNRKNIEEELSDVLIYSYMLAANLGIDVKKSIAEKLDKNSKRYPAKELINGNASYLELKEKSRMEESLKKKRLN
ncbi:hypothetical protein BG262_06665 [Floricoccus penangensis]|uniref:Nucleotide pyrophosphohydrolase n=1 Tax=Floricoccus penangensis TaxID=1859475 RepID=A0A9Q5JEX3_9LACT|nr:nucleotide pyrophosphohydrolase [Floricoccus penangensis]OFI45952.1 hypothetical protein BG262_06665 [Floricoccus penangensis]